MNTQVIGNMPSVSAFGFEFGAVTTVDINSQKVFRDVAFSWSKRFVIPSSAVGGGVIDIVVDPTGVAAGVTLVVLPVSFTAFGAGPVNIDFYFGTIADADGTPFPSGNRDNRSDTTSNVIVQSNPTINDPGVKTPFEFMIPSDGVPAVASFGGQTKDDLIFIARCDGKYMFRLTNTEANPASCVFAMTVFQAIEGV